MIRSWVASNRSLVITATSSVVVVVLVAVAAIISTGYSAQKFNLNDASVWVANSSAQFVGRANTEVFELNTVVESTSDSVEVVQSGTTVLLFNPSDAKLDIVDPATSKITDSVALPPQEPHVYLAGQNVIIYSQATGELWIVPEDDIDSFEAATTPTLNLGANTLVSVDESGLLFGFSPDTGQVFRVDAANSSVVQETSRTNFGSNAGNFSLTSVAGRWAVLSERDNTLETSSGTTDLSNELDTVTGPILQKASSAGDTVLIGHSDGLLSVPFGGEPKVLVEGRDGVATAPTTVGGCSFAAWSDGGAWRKCAGTDPRVLELNKMPAQAQLSFQLNGDRLLLNDQRNGAAWAVQSAGELIDNWDDLISIVNDEEEVEQNDEDNPPVTEQVQVPPIAVNDAFGARPARSTSLPVLLNDYDPNGDVLVIANVDDLNPTIGRLDVVNQGQELQLSLTPAASGTVEFSYTISDGRGGAATAVVTVTVRGPTENSPPKQVRSTNAYVLSGGMVTFQVLGDWVDPDGDPMYLADASVSEFGNVSHKPDGELIYADSGKSDEGERIVTLEVSDGTASASGTATIAVSAVGRVPLVADPFVVLAYSGVEVRISPLDHVRGGNATVRLNAVPSKNGVTIKPNFERGTFRFSSDTVGTHYLEYVVTDDVKPVTGIVRVDVAAPPDSNTTPITVPKTVFVPAHTSKLIDVAGTDIDPAGGVLLVTGIMNVPGASNVRAEVLEQRSVRVSLTGPLAGPVVFNYRISNGLAEAEGVITVIEIPSPTQFQPPIARDDTATVRVGDAITIDVLQNDEHPDGEAIRINPVLVRGVPENAGLLFVSGDTLRYLAPDHAGTFSAQYEILGPLGRLTAQAQVTIQVREPNIDTNHAPAPSRITARVLAGRDVRIDIPLDGVDPDGDSVQLLGQETSPLKGSVVEVGSDYIIYRAGEYSAGTDTFTYSLIDSLGARATGTVRVGISQALDGARNPVAIEDEVLMRPGATVSVRVLDNDSDPDGRSLSVIDVQPGDDGTVAEIIDDSIVRITPPATVGSYGVSYEISNGAGGTSSNFITVSVADNAPLAYPVVNDTVLTLSDILDQDTVNVNVLSRVFFADGDSNDLGVSLLPGYPNATLLPSRQIQVTIDNESQIIPFAISRLDSPTTRSYAFIWVPGFDDALPQLDRRAPPLSVVSEDTLRINLNDYVLAIGGKTVRLTDSSTVTATHANGDSLVVDNDTLQFTSADLYFGPASISFEVTDGSSASDPEGRKAILVLPINVKPRANQPPDFNGAVISFEPNQSKVIDLVQLTNYPYSDDVDELVFGVTDTPTDFTWNLDGQKLTITADEDAVKGSTTSMTLSVRDAVNIGEPGRIELNVVPSTRPLARPATDLATAKRGETTVVDVLANDGPTNPFPGRPLTVLQVIGADGLSLPPGVTVSISADKSKISATIAKTADPVDVTMQYQVADATNDPDRYVWGIVHISIQDVPDAPAKPTRQANTFVAGELTLRITPSQPNNSPITNYRVTSTSNGGFSQDCGTNLLCGLAGLTIGSKYTFQVVATNAIGDSAPSPLSDPLSLDYVPDAPTVVNAQPTAASIAAAGGSIDVTWSAVPNPNPGTAVTEYVVEVSGQSARTVPAGTTSLRISGLTNDTSYTVQVYAKNSADVTSPNDWKRTGASVHTVGPPIAPNPAPQGTSATNGDITLSWGEAGANGGSAITYSVARVVGSAAPGTCDDLSPIATGVTSPWTDTTSVDSVTYTYYIYSSNGPYCTVSSSGPILSLESPGQATATVEVLAHGSTGQFDIHVSNLAAGPAAVTKYQYLLSTIGAWRDVPADGWLPDSGVSATYGQAIDVYVRACRDASENFCGDPSNVVNVTPVNTRVTSASCDVPDQAPTVSQPTNQGAVSVSYSISYVTPGGLVGPRSEIDPVPGDAESMRVTAIVNGYPDPGYGEFTCTF